MSSTTIVATFVLAMPMNDSGPVWSVMMPTRAGRPVALMPGRSRRALRPAACRRGRLPGGSAARRVRTRSSASPARPTRTAPTRGPLRWDHERLSSPSNRARLASLHPWSRRPRGNDRRLRPSLLPRSLFSPFCVGFLLADPVGRRASILLRNGPRRMRRPPHFDREMRLSSEGAVDDLVLDGPTRGCGAVGDCQLRVDVLDVVVRRLRRDEQLLGDLASGSAFGDQSQHVDLAASEAGGDRVPGLPGEGLAGKVALHARIGRGVVEIEHGADGGELLRTRLAELCSEAFAEVDELGDVVEARG